MRPRLRAHMPATLAQSRCAGLFGSKGVQIGYWKTSIHTKQCRDIKRRGLGGLFCGLATLTARNALTTRCIACRKTLRKRLFKRQSRVKANTD